jgi:PAS domain-containing protein
VADEGVYYFAAKDVTDRHEAEVLSHHSEALLQTLTANLPDTSVFLIGHDLRILIAHGAMISQLTWLDESMFRGRKVTELHAEVPEEVLARACGGFVVREVSPPGWAR